MANITLTVSAAQAARIAAALGNTPYSKDMGGCKTMLIDYLRGFVMDYEREKSRDTAIKAIKEPDDLTAT